VSVGDDVLGRRVTPGCVTVRVLERTDGGWAAQLMAGRRELYREFSPVFWKPRRGVVDVHARFLGEQLSRPDVVALRTEGGFIVAEQHGPEGLVDDFAVATEDSWTNDGAELLCAAWQHFVGRGVTSMRVVSAQADLAKVAMLVSCRLRLVEQWWVRPCRAAAPSAVSLGPVERSGFTGVLTAAPPVYDPGGPVLFIKGADPDTTVTEFEDEAAKLGAAVVVVSAEPDAHREPELRSHGFTVASQWYRGQPHRTGH
jgi:hypothetical protein